MNRRDHHCSPIEPRLLRALIPPLGLDRPRWRVDARLPELPHWDTASGESSITWRKSATDSSVSQLSPVPTIASRQRLLVLDHLVDPLLHRADADELADLDVATLPDPERAVSGLVLDSRVPPPVDVDDMIGRGQVQAGAARLQRQQEHGRPGAFLEFADASRRAASWPCRRAGNARRSRAGPPGTAAASAPNSAY